MQRVAAFTEYTKANMKSEANAIAGAIDFIIQGATSKFSQCRKTAFTD